MFLLRVYSAIKPVTSFCQVFKVEICKANTTVTWQVDIICHKAGSFTFSLFLCPNTTFTAVFGHFFFVLKYRESFWEILRDSKFQNFKVILVRFGAFMTETFERHHSNQNLLWLNCNISVDCCWKCAAFMIKYSYLIVCLRGKYEYKQFFKSFAFK